MSWITGSLYGLSPLCGKEGENLYIGLYRYTNMHASWEKCRDRLWKMEGNCRTWVIDRKAYIEVILGSVYLIQTLVLSMRNIFLLRLHNVAEAAPREKVYDFNTKCRLGLQSSSIWNRPWCSTSNSEASRGTGRPWATFITLIFLSQWDPLFFWSVSYDLGAMMLLEIEVSNQALAVKFPLAWQKQTPEHGRCLRVPLMRSEEGGWDLWSGTQQIFIGINIQNIPVWLFFLVKYLPLAFFEGGAEVDDSFPL